MYLVGHHISNPFQLHILIMQLSLMKVNATICFIATIGPAKPLLCPIECYIHDKIVRYAVVFLLN